MPALLFRRTHLNLRAHTNIPLLQSTIRRNGGWSGRQTSEHVTNREDELDIQSSASKDGKRQRAEGDGRDSSATSEKDEGNQNEKAKRDHPEAPGPVIGMNDERGGKGYTS